MLTTPAGPNCRCRGHSYCRYRPKTVNRYSKLVATKETFETPERIFHYWSYSCSGTRLFEEACTMKFSLWAPLTVSTLLFTSLWAASATSSSQASTVEGRQSAIQRTILRRADVPGTNYEVVYALVEIAAHSIVPRHTHPGMVFGYLVSGDYTILISGSPHSIRAGESWEVPAGVVHEEHTGAGGAKILAVFTVEKGKPLTATAQ